VAGGAEPKNFGYLAQSSTYTLTHVKDSDEFEKLKSALAAFDLVGEVRLRARLFTDTVTHALLARAGALEATGCYHAHRQCEV